MKQTVGTRKYSSSNSGDGSGSEQELYDMCAIGEDSQIADQYLPQEGSTLKPFAGFGSYRHIHGSLDYSHGRSSHANRRFSSEAPAILGGNCSSGAVTPEASSCQRHSHPKSDQRQASSSKGDPLMNISQDQAAARRSKEISGRHRLPKQKSWSSETDREEAWERRKDRHSIDPLIKVSQSQTRSKIGRSVSDCSQIMGASEQHLWRTRSLTDEDLDELRGCIDLGFGFSNQADDPKLWKTFPALELCYAISQQFKDQKHHQSPISTLDSEALDSSTIASKPASVSWTISSPGDHPQVIKDRLRHWAKAVAVTIRQKL